MKEVVTCTIDSKWQFKMLVFGGGNNYPWGGILSLLTKPAFDLQSRIHNWCIGCSNAELVRPVATLYFLPHLRHGLCLKSGDTGLHKCKGGWHHLLDYEKSNKLQAFEEKFHFFCLRTTSSWTVQKKCTHKSKIGGTYLWDLLSILWGWGLKPFCSIIWNFYTVLLRPKGANYNKVKQDSVHACQLWQTRLSNLEIWSTWCQPQDEPVIDSCETMWTFKESTMLSELMANS